MPHLVGIDDDLNLYAYVGNDPTNSTDPTGEFCWFGSFGTSCDSHGTAQVAAATATAIPITGEVLPEVVVQGTRTVATTAAAASGATLTAIASLPLLLAIPSNGLQGHDFNDESIGKRNNVMTADKAPDKKGKAKAGEGKKTFAKDKDFRRWFHKEYKGDVKSTSKDQSNPDVDLDDAYDQWLGEGKPKVD